MRVKLRDKLGFVDHTPDVKTPPPEGIIGGSRVFGRADVLGISKKTTDYHEMRVIVLDDTAPDSGKFTRAKP